MSIEQIADNLARSMGHKIINGRNCGQLDRPCTCGEASKQAQALHDYYQWKRESLNGRPL